MRYLFATALVLSSSGLLAAGCGSSSGDVQKLCAFASACGNTTGFLGFGSTCEIFSAYETLDASLQGTQEKVIGAEIDCVNGASDCAAARACTTATTDQAAACKGGTTTRCSGDVVVQCGTGTTPQIQDCGRAGLKCFEDGNSAACGTGSCTAGTTKPTCDGDDVVTCAGGGALQRESCKLKTELTCSGSGCTTHVADTCAVVNGQAQCVGSGDTCDDSTFKAKCDGTKVVTCTGGKVATLDCTQIEPQTTCKDDGNGNLSCAGAGTECTDQTPATCKDGVISYCFWGKKTSLDCKSYGLSGCATGNGGNVGCTP